VLTAAAVLAASLVARLVWLDGEFDVNEPDEIMYLHVAENFARGVPYPRYDYETRYRDGLFVVPPFPLYTAGLVFRVFGPSLRTFRAMSVAFGVASVGAFAAFCGLYLEGLPLVVAVMLFAFSPIALRESTQALLGAPAVFFLLIGLWAYVRHARDGLKRHLVAFGVALGATAACKQYGILVGGLLAFHWCWLRVATGGPSLRRMLVAFGVAVATFCLLVPWVFWRPRDSMHLYLYQSLIVHIIGFLRGQRGGGTLFSLPYPELVLARGLVGVLGLVAFVRTWRRKWDVALFYGVLLGLPIIVVREVRYLSLALPIGCLFGGYLVSSVGELARRSRLGRVANALLVAMLVGSLVPASMLPWRTPSGLADACRFVAAHTSGDDLVLANYWRPVIERLTGRKVPRECEWLNAEARRLIEAGQVKFAIVDDSDYTRSVLHTPERASVADWVRRSFPVVWSLEPPGGGGATVYWTGGPGGARARQQE
jgi:4-amino-4-deoxy-L-arabinose transferase-like glycosyltransferase